MTCERGLRNNKNRGSVRPLPFSSSTTRHSPLTTHHLGQRGWEEAGVTLLELLVSVTIVSLLATTALFAWRAGVSGWEKASVRLEHDRTVLAVHELLTEQIASMTPYVAPMERGGRVMFFQGEADTARFVSRHSLTHRAASGLYLVEYHVTEQENATRQLLIQEEPLWGPGELTARVIGIDTESGVMRVRFQPFERGPEAAVLLEGLRECRFEYYERGTPASPGTWTSEWSGNPNEVPSAMRIHAIAAEDSGDLKPVTITAKVQNYASRQQR
jgi:prepilin-type N-terminal cleavage/methylation domain-containing protein